MDIGIEFRGTGRTPLVLRALHQVVSEERPWQDDGLCREVDGEIWFPEKGISAAPAVEMCNQCPVIEECREYALTNRIRHGVWGATTERQRWRLFPKDEAA